MTPILFEAGNTDFSTHGIGDLTDVAVCGVTMTGLQYELYLEYPADGKRAEEITERRIILTKPCQTDRPQPFVIYRVQKNEKNVLKVYARHIAYDLQGIPVAPFTATSAADYAAKLNEKALIVCPFTFSTDVDESDNMEVSVPVTAWLLLGSDRGCWGSYGGEITFDRFEVKLLQHAGEDRGVVIEYGKDLITADMERNIANVYTGVLPYYHYEENGSVTRVIGDVQRVGGFSYDRILPVDITPYCAQTPTKAQVNSLGRQWIEDEGIGKPVVNLRLSYAQLRQTVRLGDTVTVRFLALGIDVKAKVTKTLFDANNERYTSVEVGSVRPSLSEDFTDAGRLKKGLLPVERIRDGSLTTPKYAKGSVDSSALMDWSVVRSKLSYGSVTGGSNGAIAQNTVTTVNTSSGINTSLGWADFWSNVYYGNVVSQWIKATYLKIGNWEFTPTAISYKDNEGITQSRVFLTAT